MDDGISPSHCPACGVEALFDYISGGLVCTSCGAVQEDTELVHNPEWDSGGQRTGFHVAEADTGERAGASALGDAPLIAFQGGSQGQVSTSVAIVST